MRTSYRHAQVLDVFFGCGPEDVANVVMFTPIPAFYRTFVERADNVQHHRGWWRLSTGTFEGSSYSVVLHFEGTRVSDPVRSLAGPGTRLAFLGLAGTLADQPAVGDYVRIGSAVRNPDGEAAEICDANTATLDRSWNVVRSYTADGLLDEAGDVAAELGATVVDLESYFFLRTAHQCRADAAIALAVITDRPGEQPFWAVPLDDDDLVSKAMHMAQYLDRHWLKGRN